MKRFASFGIFTITGIMALHCFSLIKISWLQGSHIGSISGTFWILSSLITLGSGGAACASVGLWYFLKYMTAATPLTLGIPTLLAAFSYNLSSSPITKNLRVNFLDALVHVGMPLLCMALFIAANGLNMSSLYTIYWLIPLALWVARQFSYAHHEWSYALSSTFIAHAAGSILWVAVIPMTPEQWFALIPVVAVERLVLAVGQIVTLQLAKKVAPSNMIDSFAKKIKLLTPAS